MPGDDLAGVGGLLACQDPKQGCLSGTVEPEDDDLGTPVNGQVHPGEDLQGTVGLGEVAGRQRRLATGGRVGEADGGHLVDSSLSLYPGKQLLGAPGHLLGGNGLRRLGMQLVSLDLQAPDRASTPRSRCRGWRGWRRGGRPC